MSEPTVTSTSSAHTAPVSETSKPHPHSVAHEEIPPESRPVGSEEHGTTGPDDPPPGAKEGEQYPPQLHAGKVGYGPHYAEVHGKENGLGAKLTGVKEQLKGMVTRNHELQQKGKERRTGELAAKEHAEDDAQNPFQHPDDNKDKETKTTPGDANPTKSTEFRPDPKKTDTQGAPVEERIPSTAATPAAEADSLPRPHDGTATTTRAHDPTTTTNKSYDATNKSYDATTKSHDTSIGDHAPRTGTGVMTGQDETIRH
ncbi:hypothetical protein BN14_10161 [Rhizoctonia solani AG-1 IB]|uniref:Proteophosphoglycan ppg4 n=2 Tax=Rhizoctonia solani TaxID=456999 RepID=A0A8H3GCV8_9AGAM|nr:unnamed protein product [Rhizoctonia solani]CCO36039.1 hypothetical protein BN14_10161 [Rhizoctonia solani AG-1 IB]